MQQLPHPEDVQPDFVERADAVLLAESAWQTAILPVSLAIAATLLWLQWRQSRRGRSRR